MLEQQESTILKMSVSWKDRVMKTYFRNMIGRKLPLDKFGYKDALSFLKERFSDCFLVCININHNFIYTWHKNL